MSTPRLLSNPYVVAWWHDNDRWPDIAEWLKEHVASKFDIVSTGHGAMLVQLNHEQEFVGKRIEDKNGVGFMCLFMFESVRDAMLFKLTWSNDG